MSDPQPNDVPLLGNLDTDAKRSDAGEIDNEKFGIYDEADRALKIYARMRKDEGSIFWRAFDDTFSRVSIGINGRGRADAIHGESVKHGSPADINAMMQKPGFLDRLLEVVQPGHHEQKEKERMGIPDEQNRT